MGALRGARAALALLLAAALGPGPARPHPQCLDFKPPFRPPRGLAFCRRYADFGCCDPRRDRALLQRFYRLSARLDGPTYAACAGHLQDLLCQVRRRGTVWHGTARRGTARLPHGAAAAPGAPAAQRGGGGIQPLHRALVTQGALAQAWALQPPHGALAQARVHPAMQGCIKPRCGCRGPGTGALVRGGAPVQAQVLWTSQGCVSQDVGTPARERLHPPVQGRISTGTGALRNPGVREPWQQCPAQTGVRGPPHGCTSRGLSACCDPGTGAVAHARLHQG